MNVDSRHYPTLIYEVRGRVAHIILNRPTRGNGIIGQTALDLQAAVETANLDPRVHVIGLSGRGKGFCGGYDLVVAAENSGNPADGEAVTPVGVHPEGSPLHPLTQLRNHDPSGVWDPVVDYQMMSRNVRGFMSLFFSDKPVVVKVHGFCVAGGTDLALCADQIVIEDTARIGYPPSRVWGTPTTALWMARLGPERAKRLAFTGDLISGKQAVEWGLCIESAPAADLDALFEKTLERLALVPISQLVMQKLVCNQHLLNSGLLSNQTLSVFFDGVSRHTREGYAFQELAASEGFKAAVRARDEPFDRLASRTPSRL